MTYKLVAEMRSSFIEFRFVVSQNSESFRWDNGDKSKEGTPFDNGEDQSNTKVCGSTPLIHTTLILVSLIHLTPVPVTVILAQLRSTHENPWSCGSQLHDSEDLGHEGWAVIPGSSATR